MSKIVFQASQKEQLIQKLQKYMSMELDVELGQFDADFLLDFISKEMGSLYYNQGLYDAQTVLADRVDSLTDAIYQLEQ
ncbi:DUF2164 domain-containing protein [Paraglaciecola psychrophila]|uniref:DUF2164 domain-containing protein n=1 Tax=Paraglaciecola psychrophila 170 TaxID=1129794 RepID=K7AXV6_9ALTE|nr:DUF2164 domain-containing protein [Paraglaciecola psychrophila]AGH46917.1 hypothetical protein C427_4818 [Paraglaciecola psychrophila 170]GAC39950.1 conserved hypothetical protein [Paraglaciecola psychrophila 170]